MAAVIAYLSGPMGGPCPCLPNDGALMVGPGSWQPLVGSVGNADGLT
ncbi:hypothetical protein JKG47_20850 [Acidithiobacillus sp. MC6.1]|nr:hypothetical protein [Acidithiobacillus sp. MC6.1]